MPYDELGELQQSCVVGVIGFRGSEVDGMTYLQHAYGFEADHLWR